MSQTPQVASWRCDRFTEEGEWGHQLEASWLGREADAMADFPQYCQVAGVPRGGEVTPAP